jgi:hypothetical protein
MVDRVNLLGTVRLYAMKNYTVILDADVHVRIYGQLLDQITRRATDEINKAQRVWWGKVYPRALADLESLWKQAGELKGLAKEAELRAAHAECIDGLRTQAAKLTDASNLTNTEEALLLAERPLMLYRLLLGRIVASAADRASAKPEDNSIFAKATNQLNDARRDKSERDEDLAQINHQSDIELIRVKTYIDELGRDAIGGLPFRINRARYYADMYRSMVETLRVGSIDTWWDYKQLATRGVEPPLKFIDNVGIRLDGLRVRLRDAMEAVQTSAIANQTEATRDNTYQLEVIAKGILDVHTRLGELNAKIAVRRLWIAAIAAFGGLGLLALGVILGNAVEISIVKIPLGKLSPWK